MTIDTLITLGTARLRSASIKSARLDVELLLAHIYAVDRSWLHAHGDATLTTEQQTQFESLLARRCDHVPVAYLLGYREFYGRSFLVTPATLVPRPESEIIIDILARLITPQHRTLLDVGTGSGCLGITAKLEHPDLTVTLSDISQAALNVARDNAHHVTADVTAVKSDLLAHISGTFDIIIANLPYVDRAWEVSPDTVHEPALALYANDQGLELIKRLIEESLDHLSHHGYILLEADPSQHTTLISYAANVGYHLYLSEGYCIVLTR